MAVAFFDLDKTLIAANSAGLWVQYELQHGHITRWQAAHALGWLVRYKLGAARMDRPMRTAIATLRGKTAAPLQQRFAAFYQERVRHLYRPGARSAIQHHRTAGHRLVLLTSTTNYLAQIVCADLHFDDYVCTQLAVDTAGYLTGRPVEPLCYGPGKLYWAQRWVEQNAVPTQHTLADSTFYTDSAADLPVLLAVGQPICVNPDPVLRLRARRLGWRIQDWGRPLAL